MWDKIVSFLGGGVSEALDSIKKIAIDTWHISPAQAAELDAKMLELKQDYQMKLIQAQAATQALQPVQASRFTSKAYCDPGSGFESGMRCVNRSRTDLASYSSENRATGVRSVCCSLRAASRMLTTEPPPVEVERSMSRIMA